MQYYPMWFGVVVDAECAENRSRVGKKSDEWSKKGINGQFHKDCC